MQKRTTCRCVIFTSILICILISQPHPFGRNSYQQSCFSLIHRVEALESQLPDNAFNNDYIRYGSVVNSYLTSLKEGGFLMVHYVPNNQAITARWYDHKFNLASTKLIPLELPIFGGFHHGQEYFFVVVGDMNLEESPQKESLRIIKYDKNFNRIGATSLYGWQTATTTPFMAGSLRMADRGDDLIIHAARERFTSSHDGLRHQSNMTYLVEIEDMNIPYPYMVGENVSHSFNQFVAFNGEQALLLDHGDAYPRSIVMMKTRTASDLAHYFRFPKVHMLIIGGTRGDNNTGASVGGFEISGSHYLVAGNSMDQSNDGWFHMARRNIFVSRSPVDPLVEITHDIEADINWITHFTGADVQLVTTPHLVKINENRLFILWNDWWEEDTLFYVEIDGRGDQVSGIQEARGRLSDCKPIVHDNRIVWYTIYQGQLTFHQLAIPVQYPEPDLTGWTDWHYGGVVTADKEWRIVFNREINPESIGNHAVWITDSWLQAVPAHVSPEHNQIRIQPQDSLAPGHYRLWINQVSSLDGQILSEPVTMRFAVEDR